jgi:hypothetical protein
MTPATYVVNVPDVGTFEVRKRTLRVQMAIHAELNRLTEGAPLATLSDWFIDLCGLVAELKGLIIKAPDGWSMEDIDPLDDGYDRLRAVYRAIRTQEDSFRTQAKGDQTTGAGGSEQPAMVVPGSVSAATE